MITTPGNVVGVFSQNTTKPGKDNMESKRSNRIEYSMRLWYFV